MLKVFLGELEVLCLYSIVEKGCSSNKIQFAKLDGDVKTHKQWDHVVVKYTLAQEKHKPVNLIYTAVYTTLPLKFLPIEKNETGNKWSVFDKKNLLEKSILLWWIL